jgi:hypothetical protein
MSWPAATSTTCASWCWDRGVSFDPIGSSETMRAADGQTEDADRKPLLGNPDRNGPPRWRVAGIRNEDSATGGAAGSSEWHDFPCRHERRR